MRLLLDAHVSGRRVGEPLRQAGHDILAAGAEPALGRLSDEALLEVAAEDGRVLVTFDVADFLDILRGWAERGRSHAGVILVYGLPHDDFGPLLRGLDQLLGRYPEQQDWRDLAIVLSAPADPRP